MRRRLTLWLVLTGACLLAANSYGLDKRTLRWVRQRPRIDSIAVDGNHALSDSKIKSRMYSRTYSLWRALKGDRRIRVQRETLGRDTLAILLLYYQHGFIGVRIREDFEVIPADSNALVRVTIEEGRRFVYGDKRFTGRHPKSLDFYFNKIVRPLKPGEPVNPLQLRATSFNMKTFLANRGYPYATIAYTIDTTQTSNVAGITYRIDTDSLVHFGEVRISGVRNFPEYTARRELKLKPGNLYRRDDILDSQRRLYESGYFTTVQLKPVIDSTNRLRPDFELRVRERKAHFINFATGAGQSVTHDLLWDFSGGFGVRNFLKSRRMEINADYSFSLGQDSRLITHRYRLRYTEPWLFGLRMPLFLTGQYEPPLRDDVQQFTLRRWAVSARSTKRFGRKYEASLGIQYESVKITGVPEDQIDLIRATDTLSVRRRITFRLRRDSRDDPFIPTAGNVTDISLEYVGGFLGGDDEFYKIQTYWTRYYRLGPSWVSATRFMVNWAEPFGKSRIVPLDEALYLGGANTVRSFRENHLGPLDADGNPLGAKIAIVINEEFRWRTIQVLQGIPLLGNLFSSLPLWQSAFIDIGNGFSDVDEIKLDNFAYVYGTGFQIISPAGPIRLDYARRIKTKRFGFADRWHFTILYAF
ncbi:MAG: hypothetical protein D6800_05600 [Candidatus Zixiibacteriota bacterium]|nr:MAG: hypothetical protein D6800_05600 [candidate division Zixibacteria bacterium]